jgi:hypothetical protein
MWDNIQVLQNGQHRSAMPSAERVSVCSRPSRPAAALRITASLTAAGAPRRCRTPQTL